MGRKKFLIGALVVVIAIGVLGWNAFGGSATYYLTTSELAARGEAAYGENLRVAGNVAPGSVQANENSRGVSFTVSDADGTVAVVYEGTVPDTFQEGTDVVVQGMLTSDGVFRAETILVSCPTKYEPE